MYHMLDSAVLSNGFGLAHDEKCCEDWRNSVMVNIRTRGIIGTGLGLLWFLFHCNESVKTSHKV